MRTQLEEAQLLHTIALWLALDGCGVACSLHSTPGEAPVVRLDALDAVEVSALADGHYEAWEVGEPLAPLGAYLSLGEAVALLCAAHGGRA